MPAESTRERLGGTDAEVIWETKKEEIGVRNGHIAR